MPGDHVGQLRQGVLRQPRAGFVGQRLRAQAELEHQLVRVRLQGGGLAGTPEVADLAGAALA
jgi:hypothetical protein